MRDFYKELVGNGRDLDWLQLMTVIKQGYKQLHDVDLEDKVEEGGVIYNKYIIASMFFTMSASEEPIYEVLVKDEWDEIYMLTVNMSSFTFLTPIETEPVPFPIKWLKQNINSVVDDYCLCPVCNGTAKGVADCVICDENGLVPADQYDALMETADSDFYCGVTNQPATLEEAVIAGEITETCSECGSAIDESNFSDNHTRW